jgi:hypothetical protein
MRHLLLSFPTLFTGALMIMLGTVTWIYALRNADEIGPAHVRTGRWIMVGFLALGLVIIVAGELVVANTM